MITFDNYISWFDGLSREEKKSVELFGMFHEKCVNPLIRTTLSHNISKSRKEISTTNFWCNAFHNKTTNFGKQNGADTKWLGDDDDDDAAARVSEARRDRQTKHLTEHLFWPKCFKICVGCYCATRTQFFCLMQSFVIRLGKQN